MQKIIYQLINEETDYDFGFETEEEAQKYVEYISNRETYEFDRTANPYYPHSYWTDPFVVYETAKEAIAIYEERHGKPISGADRLAKYEADLEERRKTIPALRVVSEQDFDEFQAWKKAREETNEE